MEDGKKKGQRTAQRVRESKRGTGRRTGTVRYRMEKKPATASKTKG